jgi:predicted nuclease of predicted toxin-antitoxin system
LTIQFQADADLNHAIVTAIRRKEPAISFLSAADAKLEGIPDPEVLAMAAAQGRLLVTHDRQTMPEHFWERLAQDKSSPGVLIVSQFEPLGPVVETIVMIWAELLCVGDFTFSSW